MNPIALLCKADFCVFLELSSGWPIRFFDSIPALPSIVMSSASTPDPEDSPISPSGYQPSDEIKRDTPEGLLWNLDGDEQQSVIPAELRGAVRDELPPANISRTPRLHTTYVSTQIELKSEVPPALKSRDEAPIKLNIKPQREAPRPGAQPPRRADILRDFADLEQWADDEPIAPMPSSDAKDFEVGDKQIQVTPDTGSSENQTEDRSGDDEEAQKKVAPSKFEEEFSPETRDANDQIPITPRLKFSVGEKLGMIVVVVLLISIAVGIVVFSASKLPIQSSTKTNPDFPIKGEFVAIKSADTYWKRVEPGDANGSVVRLRTTLLPVLELSCGEGSGLVRVIFRDDKGISVGDNITRSVTPGGKLVIPATAGFEDPGMHAVYRTSDNKPWSIEVLESGSENVSVSEFRKLFEMDISTDLR